MGWGAGGFQGWVTRLWGSESKDGVGRECREPACLLPGATGLARRGLHAKVCTPWVACEDLHTMVGMQAFAHRGCMQMVACKDLHTTGCNARICTQMFACKGLHTMAAMQAFARRSAGNFSHAWLYMQGFVQGLACRNLHAKVCVQEFAHTVHSVFHP